MKVKTMLSEPDALRMALERALGWPVRENAVVRGYDGNQVMARLVAVNPDTHYDIGFARDREDEPFEVVADFGYGLPQFNPEELVQRVHHEYSIARTLLHDVKSGAYELVREKNGYARISWMAWMPEGAGAL
jgi:hypothetical protein